MRIAVVVKAYSRRNILAEVHIAPVRRDHRLGCVLLPVAPVGKLEPAATTRVVHPHLARAERTRVAVVLACNDVLPVRRPCGIRHLPLALFGNLPKVAAVQPCGPDVLQAVAVAREGDSLTIRREPRHGLICRAAEYERSSTAGDGECVYVA